MTGPNDRDIPGPWYYEPPDPPADEDEECETEEDAADRAYDNWRDMQMEGLR